MITYLVLLDSDQRAEYFLEPEMKVIEAGSSRSDKSSLQSLSPGYRVRTQSSRGGEIGVVIERCDHLPSKASISGQILYKVTDDLSLSQNLKSKFIDYFSRFLNHHNLPMILLDVFWDDIAKEMIVQFICWDQEPDFDCVEEDWVNFCNSESQVNLSEQELLDRFCHMPILWNRIHNLEASHDQKMQLNPEKTAHSENHSCKSCVSGSVSHETITNQFLQLRLEMEKSSSIAKTHDGTPDGHNRDREAVSTSRIPLN